jgi:hypothetical protein
MKCLSFLTTLFLILGISQFVQAQAPSMPRNPEAEAFLNDPKVQNDPIYKEFNKMVREFGMTMLAGEIDVIGIGEYTLSMPENTPEVELEQGIMKLKGGKAYVEHSHKIKEFQLKMAEKYPEYKKVLENAKQPSREELKKAVEQLKSMPKN